MIAALQKVSEAFKNRYHVGMTGSKGGKNSKEEELNLRGYAGEWVVIRENKVAAHNKTLEQLLQEGTYQEDDVLFLVPPKEQFYLSGKT